MCVNELDLSIIKNIVKMTLTRVIDCNSSHFVKNVTRVESPFFPTWLESSPSHHKSWLELLIRVTLSLVCCVN